MEYNFTINDTAFNIGQIPCGEHEDKWCWSNGDLEGWSFNTAVEAQQAAIDWVKAQEEQAAATREAEEDGRSYAASVAVDYRNAIKL